MSDMTCCRTCLKTCNLNPIFQYPKECENYSRILLLTTGLEILINDNMPQLMCTDCINTVNKHVDFLKKCHTAHTTLLKRICKITNETENSKHERTDKDFNESDSDVTNNTFCDEVTVKSETIIQNEPHVQVETSVENTPAHKESLVQKEMTVKNVLKKQLHLEFKDYVPRKKVKLKYKKDAAVKAKPNEVVKNDNSGPLECKYCKKILKTKMSLNSHLKIHSGRNFICEHCGKKCMTKRRLLMHCRSKHGYEKTDKCSYCDYSGSNPELVKIHERTHTGERPYVCVCGAAFHRRSTYLQHLPIHLPEKTVPCPECPSLFKSVTLMRIHRSKHRRRATQNAPHPAIK